MSELCDAGTARGGLPRWARSPQAGIWAMLVWLPLLLADPVARALEADPAWPSWLALGVVAGTYVIAAVVGQCRFGGRGADLRMIRIGYAALAVLAVVTVALVAVSPESVLVFPLLAISAVVVLDAAAGLRAIPVVTILAAVVTGLARLGEPRAGYVLGVAVSTVLSGFGCWAFRHLFAVIAELAATREELAQVAVVHERERFSRDLHDLLGHTLSVIVVKAQAVRRIAASDPAAAAEHAGDIEEIGRRALTEVRQAIDGYRGPGLAAELERARTALAAAGVAVRVSRPPGGTALPEAVDALLGWVVREAVTNVVRHADARSCTIAWRVADGVATLEVTDDGHGGSGAPPGGGRGAGAGLTGLRDRVASAGGSLAAGPSAGPGFRLAVEVPLTAAAAGDVLAAARA